MGVSLWCWRREGRGVAVSWKGEDITCCGKGEGRAGDTLFTDTVPVTECEGLDGVLDVGGKGGGWGGFNPALGDEGIGVVEVGGIVGR